MRKDSESLVSIIVPIYNTEKYLAQCLDSICGQTYKNLEIILIDDGCTDGSPQIIDSYAAIDPRIKPIHKKNGGYGAGCNRGIEEATGRWISIIEPDDYIEPTMYQEMLDFAASFDEDIDIVKAAWTDLRDWDDPKTLKTFPAAVTMKIPTSRRPFTLAEDPRLIATHPSIWSAIYRRDFLNEKGIRFIEYPGAGWADNPFLVETMCQAQAILYLNKCFYNYRTDLPGSTYDHKTDAAVTRPFDRWNTMLDIMERIGVTDEGILAAHYVRGFDYARGAIVDDGEDNPLVKENVRKMFLRMKPEIVAKMCELPTSRRRYYYEVTGLPMPGNTHLARAAYLLGQASYELKSFGALGVADMTLRHVRSATHMALHGDFERAEPDDNK